MLRRLAEQLRQVTVGPVIIEDERQSGIRGGVVSAPKENIQLEVGWDPKAHFVAAHMDGAEALSDEVLGMYNSLGDALDCGSVILPDASSVGDPAAMGYAKQYLYPIRRRVDTGIRYWLINDKADAVRQDLEQLLGVAVTLSAPAVDQRPFVYSLDWEADAAGEKFACYLHLHSLSQAAYLEELTIPTSLRGRGLGTAVTELLKCLADSLHCRYLYLWAKHAAEPFWEGQRFALLYRANLRNERRRSRSLRRAPGWERAYFEGEPLPHPHWYYRNHPQDDLDLFLALTKWPLEKESPVVWPDQKG